MKNTCTVYWRDGCSLCVPKPNETHEDILAHSSCNWNGILNYIQYQNNIVAIVCIGHTGTMKYCCGIRTTSGVVTNNNSNEHHRKKNEIAPIWCVHIILACDMCVCVCIDIKHPNENHTLTSHLCTSELLRVCFERMRYEIQRIFFVCVLRRYYTACSFMEFYALYMFMRKCLWVCVCGFCNICVHNIAYCSVMIYRALLNVNIHVCMCMCVRSCVCPFECAHLFIYKWPNVRMPTPHAPRNRVRHHYVRIRTRRLGLAAATILGKWTCTNKKRACRNNSHVQSEDRVKCVVSAFKWF